MTRLIVKGDMGAVGIGDDVPPYAGEIAWHAHDYDGEAEMLWLAVHIARPRLALELGTRHGISTRVMLSALPPDSLLITVDPDDCTRSIESMLNVDAGPHLQFKHMTGEQLFAETEMMVDLIHIDTDPHSREQTEVWLSTWVEQRLRPGGVAIFHDMILPVGEAVRHWAKRNPDWPFLELVSTQGLGVIRRPQGRDAEPRP